MRHHSIRDIYEDLGSAGEIAIAEILRKRGYTVRLDGGNHLHDLVINGSTTIEVKTALPSPRDGNRHDWWQFCLTKNDGQHAPMQEDILILRCQLARDTDAAHHYIVPGSLLPRSLTKINITTPPPRYGGKYALFLEAWELLDAIIAHRDRNGSQIPLPSEQTIPF